MEKTKPYEINIFKINARWADLFRNKDNFDFVNLSIFFSEEKDKTNSFIIKSIYKEHIYLRQNIRIVINVFKHFLHSLLKCVKTVVRTILINYFLLIYEIRLIVIFLSTVFLEG